MATRSTSSPLDAHTSPTSGSKSNGQAIAALIVGIIGVIAAIIFALLGLILGVVAVALGHSSRKATGAWQANAGFWLGVVAIVGAIANMVATAIIIA